MHKIILFTIIGLSMIPSLAFAQTLTVPDGFVIKDEQILIVILIGVIAGGIRVGINTLTSETQNESKDGENIDKKLVAKKRLGNFISVVLASIPIGITSAFTVDLNALGYIVIFFTVYGGGAVTQNVVKGIRNTK